MRTGCLRNYGQIVQNLMKKKDDVKKMFFSKVLQCVKLEKNG